MEQTFTAGATDYITKPINWPILQRRMQQALQTRQAIANLERQLQQARANSVALETQLQEQTAHHVQFYQMAQVRTKELEQLIQLKDGLLNRVSHELRSPLTNMSLAVEMLFQQFHLILAQKETALFLRVNLEKILTYLDILRRQCKREIQLINNLLDLQLLDTGRHPLSIEVLNLGDWLTTIIQPFWQRTRERQQSLQLLTLPDLPAIQTDASILEQVVSELLTNACKYTPPQGKITITTHAVVIQPSESSSDPTYSVIHISVSNTGTEIPAEVLPKIFEPFYRVPKGDRWQQGGTGLGLALVQRMMEHLGGTIHVSSTANQTHFTVELPQILSGG
jgi:signal transduction histidine kinase